MPLKSILLSACGKVCQCLIRSVPTSTDDGDDDDDDDDDDVDAGDAGDDDGDDDNDAQTKFPMTQ